MKENQKNPNLLYYVAACLLPNIFLFYLYNSNKAQNDLWFSYFLGFAALLALISLGILMFFKKITRTHEAALIALVVSWLFFWIFEAVVATAINMFGYIRRGLFLAIMVAVIAGVLLLLRKFGQGLKRGRSIFLALSGIICLLFVFNFGEALYTDVILRAITSKRAQQVDHKTNYIVNESLENPDIYWFHMDEMMGFDGVEKYFGNSLDWLKEELLRRKFVIKEDATLNAGMTRLAIPALLSPHFYDNYLREYIDRVEHLPRKARDRQLYDQFNRDGIDRDKVTDMELFHAFMMKGYNQVTITNRRYRSSLVPLGWYYTAHADYILTTGMDEDVSRNFWRKAEDLTRLLCQATPLARIEAPLMAFVHSKIDDTSRTWQTIPEYEEEVAFWTADTLGLGIEKQFIRRLYDSFSIPSPKVVYAVNLLAHMPYDRLHQGDTPLEDKYDATKLYMPQYTYAAQAMLNNIDMILVQNPEAIIVLQADHGIHCGDFVQPRLLEKGYTPEEVNEMNYSVFSAVRIPENFDGLSGPLDPLNITRLLVNRYVGENYKMLEE